jgi:hypothetical protein
MGLPLPDAFMPHGVAHCSCCVPQAATRTKAAAVARAEGATDSAAVSAAVLPGSGRKKCRCSKADNKNVKSCAASKGTACTLDACRDKCAAHNDFVCAWYAYDAAERDCYLYETCKNEAADPDYTQYLLAFTPAAVAGAVFVFQCANAPKPGS